MQLFSVSNQRITFMLVVALVGLGVFLVTRNLNMSFVASRRPVRMCQYRMMENSSENISTKLSKSLDHQRGYLLPDDITINKMDTENLMLSYWRYVKTIQYLCRNQTRLGSLGDGGKDVCIDNDYRPRKPCLVYSFGSNYQFDFEIDLFRELGCEIHTFDPSTQAVVGKYVNAFTTFHLFGLGVKDYYDQNRNWEMKKLGTIVKELKHEQRIIDILKIDIEGGEWTALPNIIQSGELFRVRQLCIEIHFGYTRPDEPWGNVSMQEQLKILRKLYLHGFEIFMRNYNVDKVLREYGKEIAPVNELSMVNTRLQYGSDVTNKRTASFERSMFDLNT